MLIIQKTKGPADCPFCASDAELVKDDVNQNGKIKYGYGCSNPDCIIFTGLGVLLFDSEEEALTRWNTRYAKIVVV